MREIMKSNLLEWPNEGTLADFDSRDFRTSNGEVLIGVSGVVRQCAKDKFEPRWGQRFDT